MATLHHTRETRQRIGALGFAALAAKYGVQYAAEQVALCRSPQGCRHAFGVRHRVAKWRRAHPSSIEQIVMGWLDELGERYEHDRPFNGYVVYADFQLHARRMVIEVDGKGFHNASAWLGEDRTERDRMKDALYAREGWRVLRLCESCIRDGSGQQLLTNFLTGVMSEAGVQTAVCRQAVAPEFVSILADNAIDALAKWLAAHNAPESVRDLLTHIACLHTLDTDSASGDRDDYMSVKTLTETVIETINLIAAVGGVFHGPCGTSAPRETPRPTVADAVEDFLNAPNSDEADEAEDEDGQG